MFPLLEYVIGTLAIIILRGGMRRVVNGLISTSSPTSICSDTARHKFASALIFGCAALPAALPVPGAWPKESYR